MNPQGPNVRTLIADRMATLAVPKVTPPGGALAAVFSAFTTPGKLADLARQAGAEIRAYLDLVKSSPDNPYGDDDEAIAAEILRGIAAKRKGADHAT